MQYVLNGDKVDAFSSLGPEFNINYGVSSPSAISGKQYQKVGQGWGFDIGFTAKVLKKIKVSVAVDDIGSIKWNGNVYQANNVTVWKITTPGISNYNIFTNSQLINTYGLPPDSNTWVGLENKTISLPTVFRGGASIELIPQIEVGVDALVPLNTTVPGSYDKGILAIGGRIEPIKWIRISAGMVTGADVGVNIPLGITFFPSRNAAFAWQIGVSVPDVMTLLKNKDIMTGATFGFLKFSIGKTVSD